MQIPYGELARRLGLAPLQILVELAAMRQPWEECWPVCDDGFEATIREQRRIRLGLPIMPPRADDRSTTAKRVGEQTLPVSEPAAAILNKLISKGYGLKPVKMFTLIKKWVHGATDDDVRELVQRGNLEWTNPERSAVNLVADKMADTEMIVELFRGRHRP